jgi:predicted nucleotidyltransferase
MAQGIDAMTIAGIELPEAEIAAICRRHQVRELSVFGSAARGEMRPDSDIDFLVDFLPGARPGLLGVAALIRELSTVLGRRVDVAVKPALKPIIRPGVLAEARLIYAA